MIPLVGFTFTLVLSGGCRNSVLTTLDMQPYYVIELFMVTSWGIGDPLWVLCPRLFWRCRAVSGAVNQINTPRVGNSGTAQKISVGICLKLEYHRPKKANSTVDYEPR